MIRLYIGKSASGKDTYMKKQISMGFAPIISYTTRPKRDNEIDGIDYNFITPEKFKELETNGDIIESRHYNTLVDNKPDTWYYGTPKLDPKKDMVGVVDIDGAKSIIEKYGTDVEITYIHVDDTIRRERAKKRGSFDETEWNRREKDDNIKFSKERLKELATFAGKEIIVMNNNSDTGRVRFSKITPQ